MAAFKCEVDIKGYETFKNEVKWIHWWSPFNVTISSQGLSPALDVTYNLTKTNEGIGFARMQATVFSILKAQVQTNTGKAIIQNHQDTMNSRAPLAELVECHRTSTRAIAGGHVLHKELMSMKLNKEFHGSQQESLAAYSDSMYNYLEQTHGREDAQMSQPQLLTYLQEVVSMDSELNQL